MYEMREFVKVNCRQVMSLLVLGHVRNMLPFW
jgi:hypothetical protein